MPWISGCCPENLQRHRCCPAPQSVCRLPAGNGQGDRAARGNNGEPDNIKGLWHATGPLCCQVLRCFPLRLGRPARFPPAGGKQIVAQDNIGDAAGFPDNTLISKAKSTNLPAPQATAVLQGATDGSSQGLQRTPAAEPRYARLAGFPINQHKIKPLAAWLPGFLNKDILQTHRLKKPFFCSRPSSPPRASKSATCTRGSQSRKNAAKSRPCTYSNSRNPATGQPK